MNLTMEMKIQICSKKTIGNESTSFPQPEIDFRFEYFKLMSAKVELDSTLDVFLWHHTF
jgi:hypothetical protein